jgi:hypothetical protein
MLRILRVGHHSPKYEAERRAKHYADEKVKHTRPLFWLGRIPLHASITSETGRYAGPRFQIQIVVEVVFPPDPAVALDGAKRA